MPAAKNADQAVTRPAPVYQSSPDRKAEGGHPDEAEGDQGQGLPGRSPRPQRLTQALERVEGRLEVIGHAVVTVDE